MGAVCDERPRDGDGGKLVSCIRAEYLHGQRAGPVMTVKITLSNDALHGIAGVFKKAGETADAVGRAANSVRDAADASRQARPAARAWHAVAWASLLDRIFRR